MLAFRERNGLNSGSQSHDGQSVPMSDPSHTASSRAVKEPPWAWMAALGAIGLALYLASSLWAFSRQLGPSLRVEHPSTLRPGYAFPLRVELRDQDRRRVALTPKGVELSIGRGDRPLQPLTRLRSFVTTRGQGPSVAQGMVQLPRSWPEGSATLHFKMETPTGELLRRHCTVEISQSLPAARAGQPMRLSQYLRDADPSEKQPQGMILELRSTELLRAGMEAQFWLRLSDRKGRPLAGSVRVRLAKGEFKATRPSDAADSHRPKWELERTIPSTGLLTFSGQMISEFVGFELEYWAKDTRAGPSAKRFALLRAFPGSSTLAARWKRTTDDPDLLELRYQSLSKKRAALVDFFDSQGRWVATGAEPLWPDSHWQALELDRPLPKGQGPWQIEAYAGVRKADFDIPGVVLSGAGQRADFGALKKLLESQVEHWPEDEREALLAYLKYLSQASWEKAERAQIERWMRAIMPPRRFAVPRRFDTRSQASAELAQFRGRWKKNLRLFLWGGTAIYLLGVGVVLVRYRRQRMVELQDELADAMQMGSDLWLRLAGVLAVIVFCVGLLSMLMESLV